MHVVTADNGEGVELADLREKRTTPSRLVRNLSIEKKKVLKNASYVMAERGIKMGTYLVTGSLLARIVGQEVFGVYSSFLANSVIFATIAALGLNTLLVKEFLHGSDVNRVFTNSFLLRLQGAAICGLVLVFVMIWISGANFTEGMIGFSLVLVAAFQVADCLCESKLDLKTALHYKSSGYIGGMVIKIATAIYFPNAGALLAAQLAEMIITYSIAMFMISRDGVPLQKRDIDFGYQISLLKRGMPLLLSSMAVILYMKIDTSMVLYLSGAKDAGTYAAATRLCEALFILSNPVIIATFQRLLLLYKDDQKEYHSYMSKVFMFLAGMGIVIAAVTFLAAGLIIHIVYGSQYIAAVSILQIYALSTPIIFIGDLFSRWLVITDNLQMSLQRHLAGLVVNIGLSFVLIPYMGPKGAAIASVAGYFCAVILFSLSNRKSREFYSFLRAS